MIFNLIKKEFALCLHATGLLFLAFCTFVFIPNYPYEMMFFFSGLSVFFVCITARENQDAAFSCTLPVSKRQIALARILFCVLFQVALLVLTAVCVTIKQACFPRELLVNEAGSAANLALVGHGGVLLGLFNILFFPLYYKNPTKVGLPFLLAAVAQCLIILLLILLRHVAPVYSTDLVAPDPDAMGVKAIFLSVGVAVYAVLTAAACLLAARRFERTDV